MINKRAQKIYTIILLSCMMIVGALVIKWVNHFTIDVDTEPLLLIDLDENKLILHYLQNDKQAKEIPIGLETYRKYDINKEKEGEIIFAAPGSRIVKFNYITGETEVICTYDQLTEIYKKEIEELHYIPGNSGVSFVIDDKIYIWKYDEDRYREIYSFNSSCYGKIGFAYEWKNDKEIYIVHSNNLVLYHVETQEEEIILEDIGKVYFYISDDGNYLTLQKQCGERREIVFVNMKTKEQKRIHIAKSNYKVITEFSSDGKYIFLEDHHADSYIAKRYFYIYDINKDRKYRIFIDYPNFGVVGW